MWWEHLSVEIAGEFADAQRQPQNWRACVYMQEAVIRYYSHVASIKRHRAFAEREHKATVLRVWRWGRKINEPEKYADELRRNKEAARRRRSAKRAERLGQLFCGTCGSALSDSGIGRRRVYCDRKCKDASRRARERLANHAACG